MVNMAWIWAWHYGGIRYLVISWDTLEVNQVRGTAAHLNELNGCERSFNCDPALCGKHPSDRKLGTDLGAVLWRVSLR